MESELLGSFYDDMFACRIPPNHMVIFRTLEETEKRVMRGEQLPRRHTYAYSFVKKVAWGLASDLGGW
jgi:hypothetical protein